MAGIPEVPTLEGVLSASRIIGIKNQNQGRRLQLKGMKSGRLTVLNFTRIDKFGRTMWLCRCSCGTEKEIPGHNVRSGKTNSCGCICKEVGNWTTKINGSGNKKEYGSGSMGDLFADYRYRSKIKKIPFEISKEEFKVITKENCHYCGIHPTNIHDRIGFNGEYKWNGIDRIDRSLGYIQSNIVPCCAYCNFMKGTKSIDEFLGKVKRIYEYNKKEGI